MSDVLQDLAELEKFILGKVEELAELRAKQEDAAMMKGIRARAAAVEVFLEIPMAQREELLAEAITNTKWVYIDTFSKAQQDVAMLRLEIGHKWPQPDVMDSYVFMVSEVGEVGDALLRANFGHRTDYSRNNTKYVDVGAELGDVYLMLCTLATALGIDLDEALQKRIEHLREKHDTTEPLNNAKVP